MQRSAEAATGGEVFELTEPRGVDVTRTSQFCDVGALYKI